MSDPNCRRLVSECIFFDALSSAPSNEPPPPPPLLLPSGPPPPGEAGGGNMPDMLLSVRLRTGDSGISCSCGWGWKPVMQSTTRTLAAWSSSGDGVRVGRCAADE